MDVAEARPFSKLRTKTLTEDDDMSCEVHEVQKVGHVTVVRGDLKRLPKKVKTFAAHCVQLCDPRGVFICDGSQGEADEIINKLLQRGTLTRLTKYNNNYLFRTDPDDVAPVEPKSFLMSQDQFHSVPHAREGVAGCLGAWMSPGDMKQQLGQCFPGCMAGRMMYLIPFSMGPVGSRLSKLGVLLTDSSYVLLWMRIMTRITPKVWDLLGSNDFVKCIHSVGCPRPVQRRIRNHWPCNPERVLVAHFPEERKIKSFGSGFGGSSILGDKSLTLRIASVMARDEGWMAEHMLIMSVTTPTGKEYFLAAAFPSACGRTTLATLNPSLPGFKIKCVGEQVAWMRFDDSRVLRAINPEAGFCGLAPGTTMKTNPHIISCCRANSFFTNVAVTADGGYYWQGLEDETPKGIGIVDWRGKPWRPGCGTGAAHPGSRYTAPASQCPIMHPKWEDPQGVPISAIIFGGRRPVGVPLVFEAKSWQHGVMVGACVKTEGIGASETHGKNIVHDPMAMRDFIGYNFGHYLQHWLDLERSSRKMPKIFHVNWFRVDEKGQFLWPGFGENVRVLDWIIKRCEGNTTIAQESPIGYLPMKGTIDLRGLGEIDEDQLLCLDKQYWLEDTRESKHFLQDQVGTDTPPTIIKLLDKQEEAFSKQEWDCVRRGPCRPPTVDRCHVSLSQARRLEPL